MERDNEVLQGLSDILEELYQIRQLLEWDKADTLAVRAERVAEQEQAKAEALEMNEAIILRAEERRREVHQQELQAYELMQYRIKAEHEAQYHGQKGKGTAA